MVQKIVKNKWFVDYFFITIGAAFMALGISVFLVDAKVVPGGASGLAMAVHYLSGNVIPVGIMIWVINVPLYIWGLKELGKNFGWRTFYAFTVSSIMIDLFRGDIPGLRFIRLQDSAAIQDLLHNDFLFLILLGAVFMGVGLGLVFKFKGTTAGSDIVAAIMQKKFGLKPGQAIMIIDFFVIAFAGVVIHMKGLSPDKPALSLTLYALFLLYVSSKIVDVVIDGFDYARVVHINSLKYQEIAEAIMNDLSRGATAYKTRGLYRNEEREEIATVVTYKELGKLIEIIRNIDEDAFVTISNVHEVLGKGFRRRI
jgi:uncharacterized membrane-anchored protein YitT (DUF2179 family)